MLNGCLTGNFQLGLIVSMACPEVTVGYSKPLVISSGRQPRCGYCAIMMSGAQSNPQAYCQLLQINSDTSPILCELANWTGLSQQRNSRNTLT